MGNISWHLLHKKTQKRGQAQTQSENHQAHPPVNPAVKTNQGFNHLLVPPGHRTVETVGDRDAKSQLRQRKNRKHIHKKPVKPQIFPSHQDNKYPARQKFNRSQEKLSGHGKF